MAKCGISCRKCGETYTEAFDYHQCNREDIVRQRDELKRHLMALVHGSFHELPERIAEARAYLNCIKEM